MSHEGISPEDAERLLVRPMEKELRTIEGVKEMTTIAGEGQASVTLEFDAGFNSEKALRDVLQKVDIAKAELLVSIVILGVLGIHTAILVAIAIPGSFLLGILVMEC